MQKPQKFDKELTEGQKRIKKHARDFLEKWNDRSIPKNQILDQLSTTIKFDNIIRNDSLLNQELGHDYYSIRIHEYIKSHSVKETFTDEFNIKDPFHFIYNRLEYNVKNPWVLNYKRYLFDGGIKNTTTFSCLMDLVNNEAIQNMDWSLSFYENENILTIDKGGNHRTLANIMIGNYSFHPEYYNVFKTRDLPFSVEKFNNALIEFEDLFEKFVYIPLNISNGSTDILELMQLMSRTTQTKKSVSEYLEDKYKRIAPPENEYRSQLDFKDLKNLFVVVDQWTLESTWQRLSRYYLGSDKDSFLNFLDACWVFENKDKFSQKIINLYNRFDAMLSSVFVNSKKTSCTDTNLKK